MEIPYAVEPRPDTGFSNATLGMWLFLASEAMLFGALFSGYALLRTGSVGWPHGSSRLGVPLAAVNTALLLASGGMMTLASRAAVDRRTAQARTLLAATAACGAIFLAIKMSEWAGHLRRGHRPASDNFFATYYTLTGVHALHVIGGLLLIGFLAAAGDAGAPARFASRVRQAMLYWQFVDIVWVVLFVTVYLL